MFDVAPANSTTLSHATRTGYRYCFFVGDPGGCGSQLAYETKRRSHSRDILRAGPRWYIEWHLHEGLDADKSLINDFFSTLPLSCERAILHDHTPTRTFKLAARNMHHRFTASRFETLLQRNETSQVRNHRRGGVMKYPRASRIALACDKQYAEF